MTLYTHLWILKIEIDENGQYINIEQVGENTPDNRLEILSELYSFCNLITNYNDDNDDNDDDLDEDE